MSEENTLVPVASNGTEVADPRSLYVPPTLAQAMAKPIAAADVELVLKNRPMPRVPRSHAAFEDSAAIAEGLLERVFPQFHSIFREAGSNSSGYDEQIANAVKEHKRIGMNAQADAMAKSAAAYKALRSVVIDEADFLRPDSLIPMEYLSDLAMAVPVWYEWGAQSKQRLTNPILLPSSHNFYCGLMPGQRWTNTFLMFNYRKRTIAEYEGDVIPPKLFKRMVTLAPHCERVVIMTPYHSKAGDDWGTLAWQNSVDPYIIGFLKNVPLMLVIGRFSDSGTFPLYSEMVADTINFLKANITKLARFNSRDSIRWIENGELVWRSNMGGVLSAHTRDMLKAYEEGCLFDWLRGSDLKSAS